MNNNLSYVFFCIILEHSSERQKRQQHFNSETTSAGTRLYTDYVKLPGVYTFSYSPPPLGGNLSKLSKCGEENQKKGKGKWNEEKGRNASPLPFPSLPLSSHPFPFSSSSPFSASLM